MDKSGIYTITNTFDNKMYVGYCTNYRKRKGAHKAALKKGNHKNIHLQRAYNIQGEEKFEYDLLEEYPIELLPSMENYWCNMLNVHDDRYGYNILPTSDIGMITHSAESRKKISDSRKGKKLSEEHCKNIGLAKTGIVPSEETIGKLRVATEDACKRGSIKLNEDQVHEIVKMINMGIKSSIIAKQFDISRWAVANIKYNKQWKFVDKGEIKQNKSRYSVEQIVKVRELLSENVVIKEISLILNIPIGIIYKIKNRPNYGM